MFYAIMMQPTFLNFFNVFRLLGSSVSFENCFKSPKVFHFFTKQNSHVSGPMQFKLVLFKGQI